MKIQRRMTLHLTYQLIFYALLILALFFLLLNLANKSMANEEIQRDFPNGVLKTAASEATYEDGTIHLSGRWAELIEERGMWMQVIGADGKVIYAVNTAMDRSLPASYSVSQLLDIQEARKFGVYSVLNELNLSFKEPLLFLLGYKNRELDQLVSWFNAYQRNGLVSGAELRHLEEQLEKNHSYLQIIDQTGKIVQGVGSKASSPQKRHPLEILAIQQEPGYSDTNIAIYRDAQTAAVTWILYTPNTTGDFPIQSVQERLIQALIGLVAFILIVSLAASVWHSFRYGQPLVLFAGWFERMGRGQYDEVLTEKDKRKVFRRSGKMRIRYRLYKEVIQAFYQMAEQLAHTEKERKRLEKAQEEWMSGISHDLRTPLSTIQGYGYMLESAPEQWSREELQIMGSMIREKGDYMLELISDFSLVNQLKHGDSIMEVREMDLVELVRRSVLKYVNNATMSDYHFAYEGEDKSVPVQADYNWLQRLMDNLLSNAVRHNPAGVTVIASVGITKGRAYIRVADNGKGMDEETQRNLFKRYYRGTNTEETTAGSGLGMSIAKTIVEAHGGEIEIHSEAGSGTEILIWLPLRG